MNERNDAPADEPRLPPDLEELHRSLSDIRLEERASFGPELESELERAWIRGLRTAPRRPAGPRPWMAAAAAVLLLALSVPPARAAFARILEVVQDPVPTVDRADEAPRPAVAVPADPPEGGEVPGIDSADRLGEELRMDVPSLSLSLFGPEPVEADARNVLPRLRDRARAEELIRRAYPLHLQRVGVGGAVRILLYVEPTGSTNHIRVRRGSGVTELDRAAVEAVRDFVFTPAVHDGTRVGQWVEFDVRFRVPSREPTLSDLYLVPSRTPPERARDLQLLAPGTAGDVRSTPGRDQLGVFFLLHDLPRGTHPYELRATLEPERGGSRIRLRLHPQGESPFRPAWDRSAVGPGSAAEYVMLDFAGVEPGEYVLRLEAAMAGSERILESTRRLRVR